MHSHRVAGISKDLRYWYRVAMPATSNRSLAREGRGKALSNAGHACQESLSS